MNTRKYSNHQEKQVAKNLKGKKQLNSGATPFFKGDVVIDDFLIECKTATTEKESFTVKKEWIEKQKEEAFAMNKRNYAIAFNFGGLRNQENYYIINEQLFIELVNHLKSQED